MRRIDIGPLIVALGSLVLLVSLFLYWYGDETAWGTFELADVLLAALAIAALLAALGGIADEIAVLDRRWLPWLVLAAAVIVIAELLSPPPVVGGADPEEGAWIAFAAVLAMLVGAILSVARVSFSLSVEGREPRRRVAAVDHRPPPTEAGAPVARPGGAAVAAPAPRPGEQTGATEKLPEEGQERR